MTPHPSNNWREEPLNPHWKPKFKWKMTQDSQARQSGFSHFEKVKAKLASKTKLNQELASEAQWRKYHESGTKKTWKSLKA